VTSEPVDLDAFNAIPGQPGEPRVSVDDVAPLALGVDEFIASQEQTGPPLLGTEDETFIPTGGLVVVAGQAGIGKTTLVLDCVMHLVSGLPWLEIPCARPLNVLIVENEGPREQFRRKIAAKLARWPHELAGDLWIQTWRWGSFSILDEEAATRLGSFCEERAVDLIVGDPLGTLGIEGVGSPEDTRNFVARLRPLGLTENRTFMLLAHFRKDKAADEIDQLSGAWGPHLDSLLVVKAGRRDQLRLSFPKLRWAASAHKPKILDLVRATQGFEFAHEEGDPRAVLRDVEEYLERTHAKGQTSREIAKAIGVKHDDVLSILKGNDHLFIAFTGEGAKERGRASSATVWELFPELGTPGTPSAKALQTGGVDGVPEVPSSVRGGTEEGTPPPVGPAQPGLSAALRPEPTEVAR